MNDPKHQSLIENSRDMQENFSTLPVGEILRRVRVQYGLTLEQVADDTRIVMAYLVALEQGDFERLPAAVYVTGFVRTYSEYLNLDSLKMVQLLKAQTGISRPVERPKIFPVTKPEQRLPSRKGAIISAVALALILISGKVLYHKDSGDEIPALPKDLSRQMTALQKPPESKVEPKQQSSAQTEVPVVAAKPHPVVLKAVQDVWLEIRDGSNVPIFSRVLKQGEEYWVPADAVNYKMTTGNAGGLQIVVEGVDVPITGRKGEVRRRVSLNPADLKPAATTPVSQ